MRLNYIGGASATGGTGALTLTSTEGLALPSTALISGQIMDYSIIEYTDSTKATILRAETGVGTVASDVLTRSAPRTTWNGTTYVQASVTALSFGTSNVRVYCSPTAESGPTSFPARPDLSANYGPNGYVIGANCIPSADFSALTLVANVQYMVPLKLEAGFPLTQIGTAVSTAAGGSTVNVAIASCHPTTGMPGVILAAANGLDSASTGIKMGSITSRLFPPGWYWQLVTSGGSPAVRSNDSFSPGQLGLTPDRTQRGVYRVRTFANYTVGNDAMSGTSGSYTAANNVSWPIIYMR